MSSKDKTRQKLVGSMRKTKAVAGIDADNVNTASAAKGATPAAKAKQVSASNVERDMPAKAKLRNVDGYQSGWRVWPD